jgi:ribosomal protein L29
MTDAKHTPGPWFVTRQYVVGPRDESETQSQGMIVGVADVYGNNRNQDARLIAAAPELLELVEAFVAETVDYATINKLGDPENQHNVKWARKVIAKATTLTIQDQTQR